MAQLIYTLNGVYGRQMKLYDTKCVITTKKTVGSLLTGNLTDGEKTIFLCDVVGVQFKESNRMIGYLQFETPSMQMNNKSDNMFSENTFTFEEGKHGITNSLMRKVYNYVVDRVEELKYANVIPNTICDLPQANVPVKKLKEVEIEDTPKREPIQEKPSSREIENDIHKEEEPVTILPCPECGEELSFMDWSEDELKETQICPMCGKKIVFNQ